MNGNIVFRAAPGFAWVCSKKQSEGKRIFFWLSFFKTALTPPLCFFVLLRGAFKTSIYTEKILKVFWFWSYSQTFLENCPSQSKKSSSSSLEWGNPLSEKCPTEHIFFLFLNVVKLALPPRPPSQALVPLAYPNWPPKYISQIQSFGHLSVC